MPNVTIKIDDQELVRKAKVLAAENGTSLSAMVRRFLEDMVRRNDEYERARRQAVRNMGRGVRMGGKPLERDEVYDGRVE